MAAGNRVRIHFKCRWRRRCRASGGIGRACGASRSLWRGCVVDVPLVDPDGVAQHGTVLEAGYRGEHAVPPLEGRLVGDAEQLGRALDGDDGAHESNESDPDRERLSTVLKDGAREGAKPPAAAAAAPLWDAGSDETVPPGAATRALRVRPIGRGGLGERVHTDLLAAAPLVYGFAERQELLGGEARHERSEGVRSSHMDLSHPPERPPGGIVAKQRSGRELGQILCLAGKSIAFGDLPVPESSPVI